VKIQPLYDRVVVRRDEARTQTESGLFLPGKEEAPSEGTVLTIGTGGVTEAGKVRPLIVKEGERVLFGKYAGTPVEVGGEELLILREDDILGIIQEGE
jgi:chaperonin GroES